MTYIIAWLKPADYTTEQTVKSITCGHATYKEAQRTAEEMIAAAPDYWKGSTYCIISSDMMKPIKI